MTEQQDHEAKLAALREATDDGDACDPATDSDTETSNALTEQFTINLTRASTKSSNSCSVALRASIAMMLLQGSVLNLSNRGAVNVTDILSFIHG
jgi:hypothetical protein